MSYSALGSCCRTVVGATGMTDAKTVTLVQGSITALAAGDPEPEFVALATALKSGGYGKFGPATKKAVAKLNSKYGWPDDGESITAGTREALNRPDVQRLMAGGKPAIAMTDETVSARKDVVEQVKKADDAVKAAADAKAAAVTPEQKQQAQAQADAAKKQADAVAASAQQAPPEVKQAAAAVQTAATATQVAQTPATIQVAQAKAAEADKAVATMARSWIPTAAVAAGGAALGGLAGALLGYKLGAVLLALAGAGLGAVAVIAVPAALAKRKAAA